MIANRSACIAPGGRAKPNGRRNAQDASPRRLFYGRAIDERTIVSGKT
jgi:hypothetical protein